MTQGVPEGWPNAQAPYLGGPAFSQYAATYGSAGAPSPTAAPNRSDDTGLWITALAAAGGVVATLGIFAWHVSKNEQAHDEIQLEINGIAARLLNFQQAQALLRAVIAEEQAQARADLDMLLAHEAAHETLYGEPTRLPSRAPTMTRASRTLSVLSRRQSIASALPVLPAPSVAPVAPVPVSSAAPTVVYVMAPQAAPTIAGLAPMSYATPAGSIAGPLTLPATPFAPSLPKHLERAMSAARVTQAPATLRGLISGART